MSGRIYDDEITNGVTGQSIKFISGSPAALEMETVYGAFSAEPPLHFHPGQQEYFEVLEGQLTVRYVDEIRQYGIGSSFHIPKNVPHAMWNAGPEPVRAAWTVSPALDTEILVRKMFALSQLGEINNTGRPNLLVLFFLLYRYRSTFRLLRPNIWVIIACYQLLRPVYALKKYADRY